MLELIITLPGARSSVDRAPDSGSGCRGFESLRAHLPRVFLQ